MSWAQEQRGHNTFACSCAAGIGPECELEPPCERGTPLIAFDPVRGALLYTHQKRRMSPFSPTSRNVTLPDFFALVTSFPRNSSLFISAITELRGGNLLH
jgi:hypothetical protein